MTASIDGTGTIVSGQAEAGAAITVRAPDGTIIGTGTAGATGVYALTLTTPQLNGQVLQVTQADAAGNTSPSVPTTAPDVTAPNAPLFTIDGTGATATGSGEIGAIVTLRNASGTVIGTGQVGTDGTFSVSLTPVQANGGTVSAILTDAAGNVSTPTSVPAPDITAPAAPVATLDATGTVVSGQGEVGATVTVRDAGGGVLGTAIVGPQGAYSVVLSTPQLNSQVLSVTQADAAGNDSLATTVTALDRTPPDAPVATVSADGTVLNGIGEIGATVTITDPVGLILATVPVNLDGSFTVTLNPPLTNGQVLTLTQADAAGNVSTAGSATAPDLIPNDTPGAPTATVSVDGASVSGTGQVGAAIIVRNATGAVIGNAQVAGDGTYTATLTTPQRNGETVRVTQTDADGDVSPPATAIAPDLTAPNAPVAAIDPTGTLVSGTGEVGATVRVLAANGATLGTAIVAANGAYAVTLTTPQVNGQPLTVVQSDAAGNPSPASPVIAPDLTAPLAPVGTVSGDGTSLTGTGEAGATVTIRGPGGVVLGTAVVDANGNFSAPLTPAQANGQIVTLSQADAAGNISPVVQVAAPDITAPIGLTAAINGAGSLVTGTGEIGATVTVRDASGTVLGTAVVASNGSYAAILTPAQLNAQTLQVTQADAAGNVSTPATVIAPDLTAPLAPVGTVSGDGISLTGTGEAGATVTIRGPGGVVLGTAVVDANGNFTTALNPPQANGQIVTLSQADAAGNVSPVVQVAAPDITAPIGLTAAINGAGSLVTGTGEIGATVTVRDASGTILGTAVVASNGSYAAILTPAQLNAQTLQVTQADAAGNISTPATVIAPDLTAPLAPVGTVSGDGTSLTGTGEVGAIVTIRGPGGAVLGTAVVDVNGNFTTALNPPQANGQIVTLSQADAAGNVSPIVQVAAPDITAPIGLTAAINGAGSIVTGTGEAGATVTIRDPGGAVIGTAIVATNGSYSAILTPTQLNAQTLQVTQADAAGNVSTPATVIAPDLTAPLAPVGTVSGDGTSLTGTGEAGATVTIRGPGGAVLGTAVVDVNGNFTTALNPPQANGQIVTLSQADAAGNISPVVQVAAPDITAPTGLTAAINGAGSIVTGTGEAGATVTIRDPGGAVVGTAIVATNGSYSAILTPAQLNAQTLRVTQADAAGNISTPATVIAPDLTAPLTPVGTVSGNGTSLTGTGEAGATVTIRAPGGAVVGTALVDANGNFTTALNPPQANGQVLTLTQADAAGNISPIAQAKAPDITAPTGLTAAINGIGTLVTGLGEAGATVTVRGPGGAVIGTAIVAANGSYTVTLTTAQANGQALTVSQADAAGNASPPGPLTAPDITPPALPLATINGNGTIVTGSGEPGATVRIQGPQGQLVGTAIVDANGGYTATLTIPQANGQALTVTQVDGAGNVSPQAPLTAPDITPPNVPTAAINATGTIVTGTGEAGTTVEVRNTSGAVVGTGTVAIGGTYAVTLTTPQVAGETLNVGLRDAAGNPSGTVAIIAPFDISAFDNVATAQVDLVPVQTNQNLGGANYLALVSLGAVNLDAQVLAIPNVQFTVQQGHRLNATFTYDATLSLGVASGYSVVVQRFNGTNWVAVNGGGSSSLLNVSLLGGDLVASADLAPGQYRAFVTFDNTAGVGLLGGLRVTGVDSDFTDVGQIVPATTNGNVITDPGPTGQVDVVSPQTRVESVTLNGVTTAVGTNSQVIGQWGTLTISSDGRYSYTPNADAAVLGKTDRFTYTLLDASDGERESAALTITIGSPDITGAPIAVNDVATAAATFVNVVETRAPAIDSSFETPTAALLTGSRTGQITDSFTVDANSRGNITLSAVIAPGLAVVPSFTITVTNAAGTVVGSQSGTALAGVGGLVGSGISVTMNNLPSGTYNYTVTSTNTVGLRYNTDVYVGGTITHLDQFALSGTTPVSGNLLANDTLGSDFLGIKMLVGGEFVDVGDAGRTLTGTYGTLTISEVGQYTYQPFANLGYAATDPIDRFTYQLVQPDGQVSTARLDVAVDINNGVAPVFPATLTAFALEDPAQVHSDVVPMTLAFQQDAVPLSLDHADAHIALSLMEGQGGIEDVLSRYLDAQSPAGEPLASESLNATTDVSAIPTVSDITTETSTAFDPLGYLTVSVDPEQERLATVHSF
ncbi:BapA/Bap/LapF family large adhesin [uncultured Sphingomonas sp.]|uniref:BapA/Bap/LapF family large adhesin n=1 Tax=uncultured Sphingomonas sp. TaxID=158754 RepID=UPI0025D0BF94|nr:BapA/Bap/LapF family large adhesin [uncultured Sphingomonas sp.]